MTDHDDDDFHDPFEQCVPAENKSRRTRKPKATAQPQPDNAQRGHGAPFNVVVPHNYFVGEMEQTIWTTVGSAWPKQGLKPGFTLKIRDGISVSGTVYIFPNDRDRKEQ